MVGDNFLGGGNLYDDDGALITGLPFQFKNGVFSETNSSKGGQLINIYDGNSTTSYVLNQNVISTTSTMVWDFKRKIPFKNIYLYLNGSYVTFWLEGSNDNSSWTTLDTWVNAGAAASKNLLATSVNYRYVRIRSLTINNAGCGAVIYTIEGTT